MPIMIEPTEKQPPPVMRLIRRLLQPIARVCIQRGLFLNDLIEAAKGAFIDAASKLLKEGSTKSNLSRLSIMTGVHRADIRRLQGSVPAPRSAEANIVRGVISRWGSDPILQSADHLPRSLTYGNAQSEFSKLCQTVSKSAHPPAVLFELERTGRVRREGDRIELVKLVEQVGRNEDQAFELLSHDFDTLLNGVMQNVSGSREARNMHFSTEYEQIFARNVPEIREWLIQRGREFHKDVRAFLAARDAELNPDFAEENERFARVSVHSVSFVVEKATAPEGRPKRGKSDTV